MTYVIYPEKVIVGMNLNQWVSYNQYENYNRQGITEFKRILLKSKEHEYCTPIEQLNLVSKCNIRGIGTSKPKEVL